jgi:hypothetical protein
VTSRRGSFRHGTLQNAWGCGWRLVCSGLTGAERPQFESWEPSWEPNCLTFPDTEQDTLARRIAKPQLDRHTPTPVGTRRYRRTSFGTWRPEVQILSPRPRNPWSQACSSGRGQGFDRLPAPWEPFGGVQWVPTEWRPAMLRTPTTRSHGEGSIYRSDYTRRRRDAGVGDRPPVHHMEPGADRQAAEGSRCDPTPTRRRSTSSRRRRSRSRASSTRRSWPC